MSVRLSTFAALTAGSNAFPSCPRPRGNHHAIILCDRTDNHAHKLSSRVIGAQIGLGNRDKLNPPALQISNNRFLYHDVTRQAIKLLDDDAIAVTLFKIEEHASERRPVFERARHSQLDIDADGNHFGMLGEPAVNRVHLTLEAIAGNLGAIAATEVSVNVTHVTDVTSKYVPGTSGKRC